MDEDWDLENVPMVWDDCCDSGNYDGLFQGDGGELIKTNGSEGIKGAGAEVINIGIGSSNDKRNDFVNHKENSDGVVGHSGSVSGKALTQPDVIGSMSPNGILKCILAKPQSQDNDNCKRPDLVLNKKRKQVFFSDKLLTDLEAPENDVVQEDTKANCSHAKGNELCNNVKSNHNGKRIGLNYHKKNNLNKLIGRLVKCFNERKNKTFKQRNSYWKCSNSKCGFKSNFRNKEKCFKCKSNNP